jgi:outer membrane protein
MRYRLLSALLILLLPRVTAAQPARPSLGEGGASIVLSLDDAVARTLAHNPALKATRASEEEAQARVREARAGYLPRLDVVEGWQRANQPVFVFSSLLGQRQFTSGDFALDRLNHPDALSNYRAAVLVEQTLFDGARTAAAVGTANRVMEITRLESDRTAAELRLTATRAYGRLLAATALRTAARTAVEAAAEDLRRTEARRDAGLETEANVLALRLHAADAEARRVRAESDETIARAELNALMGASLDDPIDVREAPLTSATAPDPAPLEARALTGRVEMKQATLRRELADGQRRTARSSLFPQVTLQAAAEANGGTFADRASAWSVGVLVRWNVFAGGADAARLRQAGAAAARADAERERIETAIRLEVRTAAANLSAAHAREAASRRMIEQARESQRMIRDRYEAGLVPASELLRADNAVLEAEAARIAAIVDVHVGNAALQHALGTNGTTP